MVVYLCNPSTKKAQGQEDPELQVVLGYIASSWAIY
jgi:hypothetical protein